MLGGGTILFFFLLNQRAKKEQPLKGGRGRPTAVARLFQGLVLRRAIGSSRSSGSAFSRDKKQGGPRFEPR